MVLRVLLILSACFSNYVLSNLYQGSQSCASCHELIFEKWQSSHHRNAMAVANQKTVLGNFSDAVFTYGNLKTRFFKKGKDYWVNTDDRNGQLQNFKISYTFGIYPLQQYLVDMPDGRKQVLNIVWDSRSKKEGGQRWYHLYPESQTMTHGNQQQEAALTYKDALHWTGTYFNWNTRCASCHSTELDRDYNQPLDKYQTTWSEISVACESCHGRAEQHVIWANSKKPVNNRGFKHSLKNTNQWMYRSNGKIKDNLAKERSKQVEVCAHCHSRRQELQQWNSSENFLQQHVPRLIESGLYYPDGQPLDEVYVYGSFLQSKMHKAGVVCSDCHDPHSAEIKLPKNQLCGQCHNSTVYDVPSHTQHTKLECVDCHMPETEYMGVDGRRDHSFKVPNPALSKRIGSPDVCSGCHKEQSIDWAINKMSPWAEAISKRTANHDWIMAFYNSDQQSPQAVNDSVNLLAIANDQKLSDIVRGSAALRIKAIESQAELSLLIDALNDPAPLVRLGAVRGVQNLPLEMRWYLLKGYLTDPSNAVRYEMAKALAAIDPNELPSEANSSLNAYDLGRELNKLFVEYVQRVRFNQDKPEEQLELGDFYLNSKKYDLAEKHMKNALKLNDKYEVAYLNLADLYRMKGLVNKTGYTIKRGLNLMTESAVLQYAYGLWWVRQQNYQEALKSLKQAIRIQPNNEQYQLAYILILEKLTLYKQVRRQIKKWFNLHGENSAMQQVLMRLP